MTAALPAIYGLPIYSTPSLTATGSNQATALQLSAQCNTFSTVAASTGAQLPVANAQISVVNYGANALSLYPASGDQIDNNATNAAISVPPNGGSWVGICAEPPTVAPPRVWSTIAVNAVGQTINGGTIENSAGFVLFSSASITPAGTALANATPITTQNTELGTAPSTAGVALAASANVQGVPLLLINAGTAAVHVYGAGGDTIDGTAGTTGVTLTNAHRCFFTSFAAGAFVSGPEGGVTS